MAYSEHIKLGNFQKTTDDELRNALITLDGLGKEKKLAILNELMERSRDDGFSEGYDAGELSGEK